MLRANNNGGDIVIMRPKIKLKMVMFFKGGDQLLENGSRRLEIIVPPPLVFITLLNARFPLRTVG